MQPRSEPLLWLQCLALGAIPLELLLIRLVLAGADPGPVPGVERFLIWGVGVLAPAVALWRRPADWGSLLFVRQPLASRSSDQLSISASHSGLSSRIAVVMAAVILLPALWWLDDSAVLASEFSPVSGQSRLVTLLLVSPLLALLIWQAQQLVQAAALLFGSATTVTSADSTFRADAVATQRTSLGLQLLNLPAIDWPEPAPTPATPEPEAETTDPGHQAADIDSPTSDTNNQVDPETASAAEEAESDQPSNEGPEEAISAEPAEAETVDITETDSTKPDSAAPDSAVPGSGVPGCDDDTNASDIEAEAEAEVEVVEEDDEETSAINPTMDEASDDAVPEELKPIDEAAEAADGEQEADPSAPPASVVAAAPSLPIEPEQTGKEEKGATLDPEISQFDSIAGGSTEGHREQTEPSGGKKSEPEQASEPPPGSL